MTKHSSTRTTIGIIGIGHLAQYLINGFRNRSSEIILKLYNRTYEKAAALKGSDANIHIVKSNQEAISNSDIVIIATRPKDVKVALSNTYFEKHQVLVCVAAGVTLVELNSLIKPAKAIRVLPISSVAINKSPILQYPHNKLAQELFSMVGNVHVLPNEEMLTPATAIVGAFYAWMFPLMNNIIQWGKENNIKEDLARELVIETIESATGMAIHQNNLDLNEIWKTLATPGGISELGMKSIQKSDGLNLWSNALGEVVKKMNQENEAKK
ncbi:NAD(P)-binding domain-containing protein [Maribacter sp.]|uniref:pyrroline-5-carboxylate reductase family protein n=1 Tax=Maribacter sp. TaxID=1897614 RepID=UPI0025C38438|nr:NAD(P)-binding domain-containing protein [Maribacter sp.]